MYLTGSAANADGLLYVEVNKFSLGMQRYQIFIPDSDTKFSISAYTEYQSNIVDTAYQSDTIPKICYRRQYF